MKTTLTSEMVERNRFLLVTVNGPGCYTMEFSKTAGKEKTGNHMLNLGFVIYDKEKGILSNSKKRIYKLELELYKPEDRLKLKKLCDFLQNETLPMPVYYRFENSEDIYEDWIQYAMKEYGNLFSPKELGYKLDLNVYGNVDAMYGLPDGWHKTSMTVTQLKKVGIPSYKACVGFKEGRSNHFSPILCNIIPDDFTEKEEAYFEEQEVKKRAAEEKINSMELTQDLIGNCLYSINKEAKRQRNIQSECVDRAYYWGGKYPSVHYNLHRAKAEKFELYNLKDRALQVAICLWHIKPTGYHEFADMNRDMYVLGGYEFHVNKCSSENCLGKIDGEIDAERKRSVPPKKAAKILKRFIRENSQ